VPIEGLATQLRKGVIEYCVLAMLRNTSRYGGELIQLMRSQDGLLTSEGTIYPLLSRMRADGLVDTEWRETPGGSPRRYYRLTKAGQQAVLEFQREWVRFRVTVDGIFVHEGGRQR
jgi:PadR family transcriptional regulator, regulatory protein PadR